jgi:GMP synthase (glutamine-hydrolysing)
MRVKNYCAFQPYTPKIEAMSVIIVDNLLRSENDLSPQAAREADYSPLKWLQEERQIAGLALENITQNVLRMVKNCRTKILHLSDISEHAIAEFNPDAIIISGTLRDFDLYNPEALENFNRVVRKVHNPILGICGGHQLVAQAFGAKIVTMDGLMPHEKRRNRIREYEYHYIRVTCPEDPIFYGLNDENSQFWQESQRRHVLKVWQNHGLMADRVPEGFTNMAKSYLCPIQMMVKRDKQLIYTVQYHLEKSFEDWNKLPSRWEHHNDSRDGRIVFENFLVEALKHRQKSMRLSKIA